MEQVKPFIQSKAGTKAGMCLQNVRTGFVIPPKYDSAWEAWQHTQQHGNRILPKGVDVPLFYDYTDKNGNRYGHINVRLKDGRVWNDGKIFANLAAFTQAWSNVKYVGWGESINDVRVIEEKDVYTGRFENSTQTKDAKGWYDRAVHYRKRTIEEKAKVVALQKQLGQKPADAEFNALGKAMVELLAKFGYRKDSL